MSIDPALTLMQWLSPAYPVGAFAYSHGLESAVDQGQLSGGADLQLWLSDLLRHGAGWSDSLLLAAAYRAPGAELAEIDALARAYAPSRERLLETTQQGAAFVRTTAAVWDGPAQPMSYPVALGAAAARQALPLDMTLRLFLHAFVSNLVAAGQRLMPIGQTEGQQILHALTPVIGETVEAALEADLQALGGAAFLADIASMTHETQYSRIFRS